MLNEESPSSLLVQGLEGLIALEHPHFALVETALIDCKRGSQAGAVCAGLAGG